MDMITHEFFMKALLFFGQFCVGRSQFTHHSIDSSRKQIEFPFHGVRYSQQKGKQSMFWMLVGFWFDYEKIMSVP